MAPAGFKPSPCHPTSGDAPQTPAQLPTPSVYLPLRWAGRSTAFLTRSSLGWEPPGDEAARVSQQIAEHRALQAGGSPSGGEARDPPSTTLGPVPASPERYPQAPAAPAPSPQAAAAPPRPAARPRAAPSPPRGGLAAAPARPPAPQRLRESPGPWAAPGLRRWFGFGGVLRERRGMAFVLFFFLNKGGARVKIVRKRFLFKSTGKRSVCGPQGTEREK